MRRCFRCNGQGKVFKVNGGYSLADFGGQEVSCPLCLGERFIEVPKEVVKKPIKKVKSKSKKKVSND